MYTECNECKVVRIHAKTHIKPPVQTAQADSIGIQTKKKDAYGIGRLVCPFFFSFFSFPRPSLVVLRY